MRSQKAISNQFQKYLDLKATISNERDWIRYYGYYLLKDTKNTSQWFGLIIGPDDSLYTGALMLIRITFPADFPFSPPKIENLMPFKQQFNANLWSVDTVQSLMCSDSEYRPFYGLICMDILNTPHSKMDTNSYGESIEVYDKSKELYTPIINISSIMMSMRSNILNGETRLPHVDDLGLKYLALRFLAYGVFNGDYQLVADEEKKHIVAEWGSILTMIFKLYSTHYQTVTKELIDSKKYTVETSDLNKLSAIFKKKYV